MRAKEREISFKDRKELFGAGEDSEHKGEITDPHQKRMHLSHSISPPIGTGPLLLQRCHYWKLGIIIIRINEVSQWPQKDPPQALQE